MAALAYFAITIAYTWPLPIRLTSGVIHDPYDPVLNTWILWWSTQAVPLTHAWWNAPIFFPAPGTLAFSEHLLGLFPLTAPLIALTGNPLLGYNVALAATYPLSALAAYFLAFTLTRRHDAAFVAGLAYGFAPYRLAQLPHIQTLAAYWVPICLGALHRYDAASRVVARRSVSGGGWAVLAAGAFFMQALSSGYYLFFLAALLALWFLWFAAGRWTLPMLLTAAGAFGAAALLLFPVLSGYQRILHDTYGFSRSIDEIRMFSADAAGLLVAAEDLLLWGWVRLVERPESSLFPGVGIACLSALAIYGAKPFQAADGESKRMRLFRAALIAVLCLSLAAAALPIAYGSWRLTLGGVRVMSIGQADRPLLLAVAAAIGVLASFPRIRAAVRGRSALAFYLTAAAAMWVLALGPQPTLMDRPALAEAPYAWLMRLPGFDGLRVPARFWMMALACLSVVAAAAVSRCEGRRRRFVAATATVCLLLDGWPRTFTVIAAPPPRPAPPGIATRLDLPMSDEHDTAALLQQTMDAVPSHNGYSGYFAPHYYALRSMLADRDPRVLHVLAGAGPLGIVVHHGGDEDGAIRRYVMAHPGATQVRSEREWSSYRLPANASPPEVPDRAGSPVPIKSLSTFPSPPHAGRALDGDLRTRWSGGVQQQSADAIIELERPSRVGQIVIDLGVFFTDFPARLQIDVSADGAAWQPAWIGDTALHAYYGAVRHPRAMPLVFALNKDGVQFIRLRQTGFGRHDWSIAELHVLQ